MTQGESVMKQHDVIRFMKQPADRQVAYFSCAPSYLDIYSLRYRWFGAVWTLNEHNQRVVSGYWLKRSSNKRFKRVGTVSLKLQMRAA